MDRLKKRFTTARYKHFLKARQPRTLRQNQNPCIDSILASQSCIIRILAFGPILPNPQPLTLNPSSGSYLQRITQFKAHLRLPGGPPDSLYLDFPLSESSPRLFLPNRPILLDLRPPNLNFSQPWQVPLLSQFQNLLIDSNSDSHSN